MVIDHIDRVVYAVRSRRTNEVALERFCAHFNYESLLFEAVDSSGSAIYHTNVLMCIGTEFAMIGLSAITDPARRAQVRQRLEGTGRAIIDLSPAQLRDFAGNAIELTGSSGRLLAISSRAMRALSPGQLSIIEASATVLAAEVPTIELAGGSVRCMIAGIHLAPRDLRTGVDVEHDVACGVPGGGREFAKPTVHSERRPPQPTSRTETAEGIVVLVPLGEGVPTRLPDRRDAP
jgi:hypothetical protein